MISQDLRLPYPTVVIFISHTEFELGALDDNTTMG
jgi:hypothetical protein